MTELDDRAVSAADDERALWESLRRDAFQGRLWPEGDRELQQIHARHPEWLEEWDLGAVL